MPWIRDGLTRHHADLLGNGSPEPLDVWFVSDHQKRVLRTWRNPRASDDITSPGFLRAMRDLPRGDVAKISSTTPRSLTGENVRVIWVEFRRPADEAMTTSGTAAPGGDAVLTEATVDERPELLSAPAPEYPSLLRSAGIQGRVVVRAIIDATGRAEPASVQVIESAHPGFDQSARQSVLGARFRPGRMQGQAVRVLIEFPITFRIGG